MSEVQYGYVDRPDYADHYLLDSVGYVEEVSVDQEGDHDCVRFRLHVFVRFGEGTREFDQWFLVYLDRGTTVAFAQLQLLADAARSRVTKANHLVRVHFTFEDSSLELAYAYYIRLIPNQPYPVTMQEYYGEGNAITWFTHVE